jgi:hypothetical protein
MMELKQAIEEFITSENVLTEEERRQKELETQYRNELKNNGHSGRCSVDEAVTVYKAFKKVDEYKSNVEKAKARLHSAEDVIKEYLKPLKGKTIAHTFQYPGSGKKTYVFSLEDNGSVTHNHKQPYNNVYVD